MKVFLFSLVTMMFLAGCQNSAPTSALNIAGGQEVDESVIPAVRQMSYRQGKCTGTFVKPDTYLTAAHCLFEHFNIGIDQTEATSSGSKLTLKAPYRLQEGQPVTLFCGSTILESEVSRYVSNKEIFLKAAAPAGADCDFMSTSFKARNVTIAGKTSSAIFVHPAFVPGMSVSKVEFDVGVVKFAAPVVQEYLTLGPALAESEEVSLIGYGYGKITLEGEDFSVDPPARRLGRNTFVSELNRVDQIISIVGSQTQDLAGFSTINSGDSGGPLLNAKGQIVGVASSGVEPGGQNKWFGDDVYNSCLATRSVNACESMALYVDLNAPEIKDFLTKVLE